MMKRPSRRYPCTLESGKLNNVAVIELHKDVADQDDLIDRDIFGNLSGYR